MATKEDKIKEQSQEAMHVDQLVAQLRRRERHF
jgi:cell division protein FtsL